MNPEFWKLPQELEAEREQSYTGFQTLFNEKVERVEKNFTFDLTEKQTEANLKDERLLLATQEFLNMLLLQIDRLCRQNEALQRNLMESIGNEQKMAESEAYRIRFAGIVAKQKELIGKL